MPIRLASFWLLPLAALLGCAVGDLRPDEPLRSLVAGVQPSVVTIQTFDSGNDAHGLGTGFFVGHQGHLVTNFHVMENAYSAKVRTAGGHTYPITGVVGEDRAGDLILLAVDLPADESRGLELAEAPPAIADRVVVVGSPLGLEQTVSEGIVSAVREVPGVGPVFQLSAPISQGSSGSPVMDHRGRVIGVISFQAQAGQNLNFAVSAAKILSLESGREPQPVAEWALARTTREPGAAMELCQKGLSFAIRGEYKEALSYYQEAVERSPGDAQAWYGLGNCYVGLDQPEEAIAAYRQVVAHDPDNPGAHHNLGRYFSELGRYEEAITSYQAATALAPDHLPALFDMAVTFGKMDRHLEEKAAYETVVRLRPDLYPAHYQMGLACLQLGLYDEAIAAEKKALEIKPDFARAHFALGLVYEALADRPRELTAYRDAIRADPEFVPAHYRLGLLYLEEGQRPQALDQYKILKALDMEAAASLFDRIYP
jgi:tetratricopeptide (TPR) repeat protein